MEEAIVTYEGVYFLIADHSISSHKTKLLKTINTTIKNLTFCLWLLVI